MIRLVLLLNILLIANECKASLVFTNMLPWPNNEVYVNISIPIYAEEDKIAVKNIRRVMRDIEDLICLKFIESTEKPFVNINNYLGGCWSHVGAPSSGNNYMSLPWGCRDDGTIRHEFAHLLGMAHEQEREDRDEYIKVRYDDINERFLNASYEKMTKDYDYFNTKFDFQSITLYGQYGALKKTGLMAYEKRDPNDKMYILPSFYRDFSFWDIRTLNKLYKCENRCQHKPKCAYPNFINERCECVSRENYADMRCIDKPWRGTDCAKVGASCISKSFVNNECRRSCGACYRYKSHGVSTRPDGCEDSVSDCAKQVRTRECEYSLYSMGRCTTSCKLPCKQPKYPSPHLICQDTENPYYCRYLKSINKCSNRCAFTCGICKGGKKVIPDLPCRNNEDDLHCDAKYFEGRCDEEENKKKCKGSCGRCGPNYPRTIKFVCKDDWGDWCPRSKNACSPKRKHYCAKTCGLCPIKYGSTAAPTTISVTTKKSDAFLQKCIKKWPKSYCNWTIQQLASYC